MSNVVADHDLIDCWEPSERARTEYVGAPLADAAVERELGRERPAVYVELLRLQNDSDFDEGA